MIRNDWWDNIGIALSGLCALHCLAIPFTIFLLPLWFAGDTLHDWTHLILLLLIIPTAYLATRRGARPGISLLLLSGLAVITAALVLHDVMSLWMESVITIVGSGLLIAGHWQNYKCHNRQTCTTPGQSNISVQ
ncbi:MAG: MerC domain-containing protein [Fodinibius sp.]|nr:MerC domain-containing protein [Fodinibius sp.]